MRVRVRSRRLRGSRQLEQQAACGMQQAAVIKSCNKKLLGVHSGSPRLLLVLMACNFSLAPDSRVRGQVRLLLLLLLHGLAWLLTANGKWCGKDEAAGEVAGGSWDGVGHVVEPRALKLNTRQHFGQFISFWPCSERTTRQILNCNIVTASLHLLPLLLLPLPLKVAVTVKATALSTSGFAEMCYKMALWWSLLRVLPLPSPFWHVLCVYASGNTSRNAFAPQLLSI